MKILHNIGKVSQNPVVRNASKLLSANVLAQLLGLLFYPILTRLYAPADFGLFNLFIGIGSILTLFGTAEYHYSIALPKDEDKAVACFHVGMMCLVVVSVLCGLSSLFSGIIAGWFNTPELEGVYPLLGLFVFMSGLWNLLNYWLIRQSGFTRISVYQLTLSGGNVVSKYAFARVGCMQGGLVLGAIVGQVIATVSCLLGKSRGLLSPLWRVERAAVKTMAMAYRNYPLYSLPRVLINNVGAHLPVLLLTPVFGTAELGLFGMAITLAFRPINMVVSSLYQVFLQQSGERLHQCRRISPMLYKYMGRMSFVVLPVFVLLYVVLPDLTGWLLGAEWHTTGVYIRMMLPWLYLTLLLSPMGHLTDLFMKQRWWLGFEILAFVLRLFGLLLGMWQGCMSATIGYYCLAGALSYLLQLPCYLYLIRRYEHQL
ncbi:MAG: oligosaccharide flippase family protein [Paludibacteraceae bacterium]|nr:oligosaccharide flippase family protein [Paludibacteraceae bacterium]